VIIYKIDFYRRYQGLRLSPEFALDPGRAIGGSALTAEALAADEACILYKEIDNRLNKKREERKSGLPHPNQESHSARKSALLRKSPA